MYRYYRNKLGKIKMYRGERSYRCLLSMFVAIQSFYYNLQSHLHSSPNNYTDNSEGEFKGRRAPVPTRGLSAYFCMETPWR